MVRAYGMVKNDGNVHKWCRLFNEGRTNIHYKEHSGWPTVKNVDFTRKVYEKIHQNRRFTIDQLHDKFLQVPRSVVYQIVTDNLHYNKFVRDGCQKC